MKLRATDKAFELECGRWPRGARLRFAGMAFHGSSRGAAPALQQALMREQVRCVRLHLEHATTGHTLRMVFDLRDASEAAPEASWTWTQPSWSGADETAVDALVAQLQVLDLRPSLEVSRKVEALATPVPATAGKKAAAPCSRLQRAVLELSPKHRRLVLGVERPKQGEVFIPSSGPPLDAMRRFLMALVFVPVGALGAFVLKKNPPPTTRPEWLPYLCFLGVALYGLYVALELVRALVINDRLQRRFPGVGTYLLEGELFQIDWKGAVVVIPRGRILSVRQEQIRQGRRSFVREHLGYLGEDGRGHELPNLGSRLATAIRRWLSSDHQNPTGKAPFS